MGYEDHIREQAKKKDQSYEQHFAEITGTAPAQSAQSSNNNLLQQLARQAVAIMADPLGAMRAGAQGVATAGRAIAQAGGSTAATLSALAQRAGYQPGRVTNGTADAFRALNTDYQKAAAQAQQSAAERESALRTARYSLLQSRAADMTPNYRYARQQTARVNPYAGMLGPGATAEAYGENLLSRAQRVKETDKNFIQNNKLGDYADKTLLGALERARNDLETWEENHPTMNETERLYHKQLEENYYGLFDRMLESRNKNYYQAGQQAKEQAKEAPEYMARYYANLPNYADFSLRQENPYGAQTAGGATKEDAAQITPEMLQGKTGLGDQEELKRQSVMTDEEKAIATYLRNTRGENAMQAYLDFIKTDLEQRVQEAEASNWQEYASKGWGQAGIATLASLAKNVEANLKGAGYLGGRIGTALGSHIANSWLGMDNIERQGLNIDIYDPAFTAGQLRNAARAGAGQLIQDQIGGKLGKLANKVYQATLSTADSAVNNLLFGEGSEMMMSLGAMAEGVRDAKERGGNDAQAMLFGAFNGMMEYFTEHMKSDDIAAFFTRKSRDGLLRELKNVMIAEGIEEMTSETLDMLADFFMMGDKSEYQKKVRSYKYQGLSEEQATLRALADMGLQVLDAGASGAWGGLLLGGGSAAAARVFDNSAQAMAQREINKLAKNYRGQTYDAFKAGWDGQTMPGQYKAAFDALRNSGIEGVSLEQTQEAAKDIIGDMSPARQYAIWQAGANERAQAEAEVTDPITGEQIEAPTMPKKSALNGELGMGNGELKNEGTGETAGTEATRAAVEQGQQAATEAAQATTQTAQAAQAQAKPVVEGVVRNYTAKRLTHDQRLRLRTLDMIGKRLHIEINVVDSLYYGTVNGTYADGERRVTVALDAEQQAYVQVAGHEITHYIRAQSEDAYMVLAHLTEKYLREVEGYNLDQAIRDKIEEYATPNQSLTEGIDGTAFEEIVAETMPLIFTNDAYVREIVENDRTLGEKIRQKLRDCIRIFRQIIEEITNRTYEDALDYHMAKGQTGIGMLIDQTQKLEEMARAFESAMSKANEAREEKAKRETQRNEAEERQEAASRKEEKRSQKTHETKSDKTQTAAFRKWFGKSKIVNADGTPKVMYHGSQATFTVFDRSKAKYSGMYGKGFYFTDSQGHAGQYGSLYEAYLKVENPLKEGAAKVTAAQIRNFLKVVAENEDFSIENYGTYDIEKILKGITSRDAFTVLNDINTTAIGDLVAAVELWNSVNGTDFDGIIAPTETVVFRPEQIKSATDNVGTFDGSNPDIRFSMKKLADIPSLEHFSMKEPVERKEEQFQIIQRTNPMFDDYHLGIRKPSDIMTAEEALGMDDEDEVYVYPDWKRKDGQKALKDGFVRVYSSYPIREGVFVSPSRMMAKDYAGDGMVHTKLVPLDDVAWINADEGQYAPVASVEAGEALKNLPGQAKFSMKTPVEKKGDLIAVHNLSEKALMSAVEMGGFPMVSTAIVQAEKGHKAFGKCSVVFYASAIDPAANPENRVYGDDVWTPSFPMTVQNGHGVEFIETGKPVTAENALEIMKNKPEVGTDMGKFTAFANAAATRYASLDEIRADSGRLSGRNDEAFYELKRKFNDIKYAIAARWENSGDHSINYYDGLVAFDVAMEKVYDTNMSDWAFMTAFGDAHVDITEEEIAQLQDLMKEVAKLPTDYFEAKPRRVQGFDEVAAVIMPAEGSDDLADALRDMNVDMLYYSEGHEDDRLAKLNAIDQPGVRFALKNVSETPVNAKKVLEGIDGRPAIWVQETVNDKRPAETQARVEQNATKAQAKAMGMARQILKDYESTYDRAALRDNLVALSDEIAKNGASDDTLREATQLARAIIEKSSHVDTSLRDQYKDLRKTLRETPITLTETQKAEAANIAGSYGAFRRSVFGTFNLATEGTSLDAIWDEWSGIAPDLFTPGTSEGDMVQKLVDVRAAFMPVVSNPYGEDMDGASVDLALRMQQTVMEALGDDAGALDMGNQVKELRRQYMDAMKDERMRVKLEQRQAFDQIAAALRAARGAGDDAAADRALAAYRGQMKRIGAESAEAQARIAYRMQYEDRAERAKTYERIRKYAEGMRAMLAKPDKKKHVPQELQGKLLSVLDALDFRKSGKETEGTRQWKESLQAIGDFLARQLDRQNRNEATDGVWMTLCEQNIEQFNDAMKTVMRANKAIGQMTLNELNNLSNALSIINHSINTINEMWLNARHETADEAGSLTISELGRLRDNRAQNSNAAIRAIDNMMNVENLDAISFFERLGGAATTVADELREGQSKAYARVREASEAADEIFGFTDKNRRQRVKTIRGWSKETHDVTVGYGAGTQTVKMTGTQLMTLYALSRREQGRKHLLTGGLRVLGRDGKLGDNRTYKMDEGLLDAAVNQLTDDQKKTTERMQAYLSTVVSEWGNEVTEMMYLYRMFGEDNYWPIISERGYLRTKEQDGNILFNALVNAGFTKQTQDMVSNPVMIGDAIEIYSGHVSDMATFSGLAMPLDDLLRWYNYAARDDEGHVSYTTSVKKEIERTIGSGGLRYIETLMNDLNGMGKSAPESEFVKWLMNSYKRAAIMAKLRVMVQQPTAIVRASALISPKYLAPAGGRVIFPGANNIREMQEHSALAWWKSNGNYEIGTGASMKSIITGMQDSRKDTAFEALNSPAGKADDRGWVTIWQAVKRETAAEHKDLVPGTDEYWRHVVERFEDICAKTQVVDTVLTRSAMMRSKSVMQKMATAFMSEPTKNVNLIRNGLSELNKALQSGDKAARHKAEGRIIRGGMAIAAATALNAVVTATFDMIRYYNPDDRDEDGDPVRRLDMWLSNWIEDFADGMNPLSNIPYVKDVYSTILGKDVERMDLSLIASLVKATNKAYKYFKEGNPNGYTAWAALKPLVTSLGDIAGLPVSGLVSNTEFLLNLVRPGTTASKARAATATGAMEELYEAMTAGDMAKVEKLRSNMKAGQFGRAPMSDKEIDQKLAGMLARNDDRVRQAWEAGEDVERGSEYVRLRNDLMTLGLSRDTVEYVISQYPSAMKNDAKKGLQDALKDGDEASAEAYRDILRDWGVTEETIAGYEAEKDVDEGLAAPKATFKDLYQMLRAGETGEAGDIRARLLEQGKTKDDISKGLADMLATYDERVEALWKKRQSGRVLTAADYRAIQGDAFTDKEVKQAVNRYPSIVQTEVKKLMLAAQADGDQAAVNSYRQRLLDVGTKEETIDGWLAGKDMDAELEEPKMYSNANLWASVRSTETTTADMLDIRDYLLSRSDSADPEAALRSSITTEFKAEYIELIESGKTKEAERLKERLVSIGANAKTIDGWAPAKAKAEAKDALKDAIDRGDGTAAFNEVQRMLESGVATKESIRDTLNAAYKEQYCQLMDAGKEREAEALVEILAGLGLKNASGQNYYRGAWWKEQYKNWVKKQAQAQ